MDELFSRQMPHSLEAEQAVLGSILIDSRCAAQVIAALKPEDFYTELNKGIYEVIASMFNFAKPIDAVTVLDEMKLQGIYNPQSSQSYLVELMNVTPTAANVMRYVEIIRDKALLRNIATVASDITAAVNEGTGSSEDVLETAERRIYALRQGKTLGGLEPISTILGQVYQNLAELSKTKGGIPGLPTGLGELDETIMGLKNSDFIILASRPGMGKTSLALNIATNVAMNYRKKVAIFSLEMSDEQIASRILSSQAMVTGSSMRSGTLDRSEWNRLSKTVEMLSDVRIVIDDTPDITVSEMKSKVRREKDIDMIGIDYRQLMQGKKHTNNRVLEIGDITRNMKLMAKELKVPVICAAQLSRSVEKNNTSNKRPMMSDLRDSGTIEQDADTILFIYRDEYYKSNGNAGKEPETETPVAEIIVAKNRHGSTGNVKLNWIGKYTRFYSVDKVWSDEDAPPEFASGHPEG